MAKKRKESSSKTINISGDGNIIGDNNVSYFQKGDNTTNSSIQEFLALLDSIQKSLDQSHERSVISQAIDSEIEVLKELVKKPNPVEKPTVLSKLKHVEELAKTGLGLGTLSVELIPKIGQLIQWAKTIL